MKEKRLYTCEICNTDYTDKEKAKECEKAHIKPIEICEPMKYHSIYHKDDIFSSKGKNYPDWITIKFEDSSEHKYKR